MNKRRLKKRFIIIATISKFIKKFSIPILLIVIVILLIIARLPKETLSDKVGNWFATQFDNISSGIAKGWHFVTSNAENAWTSISSLWRK